MQQRYRVMVCSKKLKDLYIQPHDLSHKPITALYWTLAPKPTKPTQNQHKTNKENTPRRPRETTIYTSGLGKGINASEYQSLNIPLTS
jgi:hypothetical protein